jgi:hypothetical protein
MVAAVYLASYYVFVSIFSDGIDARWRILGVAAITAAVLIGISNSIKPELLGLALACVAAAVVSLAGLVFWIRVTRLQALKITGSYIGFVLASWMVLPWIFPDLGAHAA